MDVHWREQVYFGAARQWPQVSEPLYHCVLVYLDLEYLEDIKCRKEALYTLLLLRVCMYDLKLLIISWKYLMLYEILYWTKIFGASLSWVLVGNESCY
jgi:hypothetical protein